MARSDSMRLAAPLRGLSALCLAAVLLSPASVRADLNGHWRFRFAASVTGVTDVSEVGNAVSFVLTNGFGSSASFSGTRTGNALLVTAPPSSPGDCTLQISATIAGDEGSISGDLYTVFPCSTPGIAPITLERCGCFDGNSSDGDGCDALCHVESCYSCSGEPSVCAPQGDGTPCDDLAACTTGETCTAVVCGGGTPVSPCIDMSGSWRLRYDFSDDLFGLFVDSEGQTVFTQHNTSLEAGDMFGTVDPLTGAFQLTGPSQTGGFCPGNYLSGLVATDGRSLSGNFTTYAMTPTQCPSFGAMVTGSRCGGGTLDPGEECDDGNWTDGDGCDVNCSVEPCHTCTSDSPSVCAPISGSPCDDGDGCTLGDACQAGVCTGTAVICGPCLTCTGEAECVAAPRSGCLVSTLPSHSSLFVRDSSADQNDLVTWQWRRGEETTLAALGDPTQSTAYTLCIYDESAPTPTLLFRGSAAAVSCPGCWSAGTHGFSYRSASGATDGLTRIELRAQLDGRARIVVKGKGALLTHEYGVPTPPLSLPLRVQLHATDLITPTSTCFESEFAAAGATRNDPGVFNGRATGP